MSKDDFAKKVEERILAAAKSNDLANPNFGRILEPTGLTSKRLTTMQARELASKLLQEKNELNAT